jgi:hypothetical protein
LELLLFVLLMRSQCNARMPFFYRHLDHERHVDDDALYGVLSMKYEWRIGVGHEASRGRDAQTLRNE